MTVVLIDGKALAYRAHFGFSSAPFLNSRGENVGALYGVASTLLRLRRDPTMTAWAFCWEGTELKHRHVLWPQYKQGRPPTPEDLREQLRMLPELVRLMGCPVVEVPCYEADDLMATLAAGATDEVAIVSADKDMFQCIDDRVHVLKIAGKDDELSEKRDPTWVRENWGVEPSQTRDVLALMGDSADNVPGVPGIGQKTAAKIIAEHGDIDEMYRMVDASPTTGFIPRILGLLRLHRAQVYLARDLVTVCRTVPIPKLSMPFIEEPDWKVLRAVLKRYEIEERLRRFLPAEIAA